MLAGTDMTVDEIAFKLGFEYVQNFSALYIIMMGFDMFDAYLVES